MASGKFKPNCILVISNFLIRHGLITADKGVEDVCAGCVYGTSRFVPVCSCMLPLESYLFSLIWLSYGTMGIATCSFFKC